MKLIDRMTVAAWVKRILAHCSLVLTLGGAFSIIPLANVSSENTFDRIQAGTWVTASMYWEDKLVSTGKSFNPIGWHAAHKTLPIGTLIRVSNPKNHRSINVTVNDRGPFVANRDLDLSLGAGTLLGLQGLGTVYMEVLSIPPIKNMRRPVVESLFTVSDANANCVGGISAC
jgi:rare lipoprotein A (peptidoglycan hydrolase)